MSMFDDFIDSVWSQAQDAARDLVHGAVDAARSDASTLLQVTRTRLQEWTEDLAHGRMSQDDFAMLSRAQMSEVEMAALTRAGVLAADAKRFRDRLIDIVIDTAFATFLPG